MNTTVFPTPQSPIQQKAVDIFKLSKNISQYLGYDMAVLDRYGNEHPDIYFTGDIVRQSVSLFPEILHAEQKSCANEKRKHIASIKQLTHLLHKNCDRLEHSVSHGKDFLKMLRQEIKRFRKLQKNWQMTL